MKRPSHLTVYFSLACNMACSYCFLPRRVGTLARAGLFRRLDSFARGGGEKITFLGGEPLLNWGLLKAAVTRLAARYPAVRVTVFTNGAELTASRAEFLENKGVRLVLSLDGGRRDNERYRRLRKGGVSHAAALKGLSRSMRGRISASAVVVPGTAGRLAANVKALYSAGFRHIAWAPDITAQWGPAEARVLAGELLKIGRDYLALVRAGRPAYEIANIYELLESLRGGDSAGCGSLTLSPEGTELPCDKLLAAPAEVRRRFSGPAGRLRFFAEAAAAGADPAEPLCPAGYYSLLRHTRGISSAEVRAALDLRLSFARIYGSAMRRLVKTLSRVPSFRRAQGIVP